MSFDWKDFVVFSENLLNDSKPSANQSVWRTCVGRAYYGAYWLCRMQKGMENDFLNNPHKDVVDAYIDSSSHSERSMGLKLGGLKRLRMKSDYDKEWSITRPIAERAVVDARQILSGLGV